MSDALDIDPLECSVGGEEVTVVQPGEQREIHSCS
jgi:hypothetical protein